MAAKKTTKKKAPAKKKKRNPSVKKAARAVGRRSKERFFGMNIMGAVRSAPPRACGMLAAKWAAKKFPGVEGGGDDEDWTFANYLAGGAGGLVGGFIAENFKKGAGQKVLEGAIDLLLYKIFQNEIVPESDFLEEQFGQDEESIVLLGEEEAEEGDLLLGDDGEMYMMGADGYTRPVDERHRVMATELAQRALAAKPAGNNLGQPLSPPGTLGGELSPPGTLGDVAVYPPGRAGYQDPFLLAYASLG